MKKSIKYLFVVILSAFLIANTFSAKASIFSENIIFNSSDTIIVDVNGGADYTKIQDAIDNATDGDTIKVLDGIYNESITINKQLKLIGNLDDGNKPVIDANGTEYAVVISADNCAFNGFKVINSSMKDERYAGIKISSHNNRLMNNSISNAFSGIMIWSSNNSVIGNNKIFECFLGITLIDSNNNHVFNNELSEIAATGIMAWYHSNNNTFSDNIVETNQVSSYGIFLTESSYNKLYNNEISSKNASFPGHNDSVMFKTGFYAIYLQYSNQNEIIGNEISLYQNALALIKSNKNVISKNNLTSCWYAGLGLMYSHLNLIKNNNFINNSFITIEEILKPFKGEIPPLLKIWLNRILKSGMQQAVFSSSYLNKWRGNYWDNWPGLIPKPIKGNIGKNQRIPWRNFDLFPKIKPITIESQSDSEKERQSLVKSTEIENKLLEILTKNLDDSNEEKYGLPMFGINLLDYISENGTVPYNINNWLQDLQKMTIDLRD